MMESKKAKSGLRQKLDVIASSVGIALVSVFMAATPKTGLGPQRATDPEETNSTAAASFYTTEPVTRNPITVPRSDAAASIPTILPAPAPEPASLATAAETNEKMQAVASLAQNNELGYNDKLYRLMQEFEGCELRAYLCGEGACTIGIGFNLDVHGDLFKRTLQINDAQLRQIRNGERGITEEQARTIFDLSIREHEQAARERLARYGIDFDSLPSNQKLCLTSLAFNAPGLIGPNLCNALKNGDLVTAACEIALNSNRDGLDALESGQALSNVRGLFDRREAESYLMLGRVPTLAERELYKANMIQARRENGRFISRPNLEPLRQCPDGLRLNVAEYYQYLGRMPTAEELKQYWRCMELRPQESRFLRDGNVASLPISLQLCLAGNVFQRA